MIMHDVYQIAVSCNSVLGHLSLLHYCTFLQKVKAPRYRLISDNRLRDERGNRREHDRANRNDDRYDRMDHSPSHDANGGSEGGNHDETMYDAFGGQGLHGGPFPADMPPPPPVLMPVPGAG